jgi:hypothetical protein
MQLRLYILISNTGHALTEYYYINFTEGHTCTTSWPFVRYLYNPHNSITLNFYNNIKILSSILIVCELLWKFIVSTTYYVNEVDTYARIPQADFYTSILYFIWTSFWYLPAYVLLLMLIVVGLRAHSACLTHSLLYILLLIYSCTLIDYQVLNPTTLPFYRGESWNTLLTNSVNKYHPCIFYGTISGILLAYWNTTVIPNHARLSTLTGVLSFYALSQDKLIWITSTLFLGSWWAAQEGSWGGWWNWDPSEVFGLVVMFFYTQIVHRRILKHTLYTMQPVIQSYVIVVLVLYLFIQINFDLVSHNFGTKTNQFVDSYQLLLALLFTAIFLWGRKLVALLTLPTLNSVAATLNAYTLQGRAVFATILLVSTSLSFTDLLNNFSWSISGTNLLNLPNLSTYYATVSVLALVVLFYKPSLITIPITYSSSMYLYIIPYIFWGRSVKAWVYLNHTLLVTMLWTMYFLLNQVSTTWSPLNENTQTFFTGILSDFGKTYTSLNTYTIEIGYTQLWSNQSASYGWNTLKDSSVPLVHTFSHPLGPTSQSQEMLASGLEYLHSIQVIDLFSTAISYILPLVLLSVLTLSTSKPIIIC